MEKPGDKISLLKLIQVSTTISVTDAGTKPLTAARPKGLLYIYIYIFGVVQGEGCEHVGEMEYEQMTEKIKYGKRVESLARQFCAYVFQEATSSSITDGSLDYGMCYAEDTASLSIWNFSGFAFAAVLAIIAVIVMVSYIVYMVYKLIKDMKSKMAEVEENMKSLREEVRGMNSRQDTLFATVDQMY